ncbi:hypothetical protein [Listeria booriae]|uniref:Uncharacterized protein n=1 Tax=Listeria booriae TaxID=1552123 RepID=A0A7X1CIA4_9LIST|nr:hypothetical protein [Listeria booriae]MBC1778660.1 hypothetical protein [Listeria booriae]MBC2327257.1 hypothetical protein [Listeria booriae]
MSKKDKIEINERMLQNVIELAILATLQNKNLITNVEYNKISNVLSNK